MNFNSLKYNFIALKNEDNNCWSFFRYAGDLIELTASSHKCHN